MQNPNAAQKAKARARSRARPLPHAPANDNIVHFAAPEPLALTAEYVIRDEADDAPFEPPPVDDIFGLDEIDEEDTVFVSEEPELVAEDLESEETPAETEVELLEAEAEADMETSPLDDDAPFDPPEFDDEPVFSAPASVQLETIAPKPEAPKPLAPREEPAPQRDRLLPAIAIHMSWDSAEAEPLLAALAADPRLVRAETEIARGGLDRAAARANAGEVPDLFIIETALEGAPMLAALDRLRAAAPAARIVILGAVNDITLLRELAQRGVSDYVVPPAKPADIARSLAALFAEVDGAHVTAVIGARGGVGASTIAHNLAWSIAERQGVRTTLADFDLAFGAAAFNFQHAAEISIADVIAAGENADEIATRALAQLTPRLQLISAPDLVLPADIGVDGFERALAEIRRTASYVVLDLPHLWEPWIRQALRCADEVVIVAAPDLASLRNTDNMLKLLRSERDKASAPKVVLSMVGVPKKPEIPLKDFAEAICVEPAVTLAFEPELFGRASERGDMIYETMPDAKAALQLDSLATLLTGREASLRPQHRLRAAKLEVASPAAPNNEPPAADASASPPAADTLLLDRVVETPPPAPPQAKPRRAARTGFLALQSPQPQRRRSTGFVRAAVAIVALASAGVWYAQQQLGDAQPRMIDFDAWRA